MKKILLIVSAVIFLFLTACSQTQNDGQQTTGTDNQSTPSQTDTIVTQPVGDETTEEQSVSTQTDAEITDVGKKSPVVEKGRDTGTDKTKTGFEPLAQIDYRVDEQLLADCSTQLRDFSFGVASGGKPAQTSINNQAYMQEHNLGALCYDAVTTQKVLYLTFDVGYENGYTAKVLDVLDKKDVPAAFFCTVDEIKKNPDAITEMIKKGHIVGNHTVTHPNFSTLSYDEIIAEVKGFDDYVRENFGYSAPFFRYPEGKYSEYSEKILTELGFTSVFWSIAYADWDLKNQPDPADALDTLVSRLHPGAVILLHAVSPTNYAILEDFIDEARQQGYTFVPLTDYTAAVNPAE